MTSVSRPCCTMLQCYWRRTTLLPTTTTPHYRGGGRGGKSYKLPDVELSFWLLLLLTILKNKACQRATFPEDPQNSTTPEHWSCRNIDYANTSTIPLYRLCWSKGSASLFNNIFYFYLEMVLHVLLTRNSHEN